MHLGTQTRHFCYSIPYSANLSERVPRKAGKRGQTNTAISFFLLFRVAKRKVTRATGRQRKLSAEYFMRARKYECLTACTGTSCKFTTLRDGTARFYRECKFVSCYLREVERRRDHFPREARATNNRVTKTFNIFGLGGGGIATGPPPDSTRLLISLDSVA